MSREKYVQEKGNVEEEIKRKKHEEKEATRGIVKAEVKKEAKPTPFKLPAFNIRLLKGKEINPGGLKPLNISLKELKPPRLGIMPANIALTTLLNLRIKMPQAKELSNIRVPIDEPLTIQTHIPPIRPQIKANPPRNFSVTLFREPEQVSSKPIKVALLKTWPLPTLQPKILSSISIRKQLLHKPKLKLPHVRETTSVGEKAIQAVKEGVFELTTKHLNSHYAKYQAMKEGAFDSYSAEAFNLLPEDLLDERYLDEEYRKLGGFSNVSAEGLVCILVDKDRDFHEFIKLLCTEMWRIKGEGLPDVSTTSCDEELSRRKLREDVIEIDIDIEKIDKFAKEFTKEIEDRSIEGRLRFLLLPVDGKSFDKAYNLLTSPELRLERYLRHARFFAYKLKKVDEEFLGDVLISAFGFAKTPPHSISIGEYALELEGKFREKLIEIMEWVRKKVEPPNWPEQGDEGDQQEGWLHLALKHLVYAHLLSNEKVDIKNIKSENKIIDEKIADVVCEAPSKLIAIEIETMYGTGDPIGAKINQRTIKPYLENRFNGELWLVIPNLHALLYAGDLLRLRRSYREEGLNFEIYVADVTGEGAKLIYGEERKPGLIKLIDVLKFIKHSKAG